jgi:ATP-dependent Zn protease
MPGGAWICDLRIDGKKVTIKTKVHAETVSGEIKEVLLQDHANGVPIQDPTLFQKLFMTTSNLQSSGIIAVGALLSVSLQGVVSSMFKSPYSWFCEWSDKKYTSFDRKMSGVAKHNEAAAGYEKVYFSDMVGCEELEILARKIANFIKHPERYERAQIEEHRGILLHRKNNVCKSIANIDQRRAWFRQRITIY